MGLHLLYPVEGHLEEFVPALAVSGSFAAFGPFILVGVGYREARLASRAVHFPLPTTIDQLCPELAVLSSHRRRVVALSHGPSTTLPT